MLSIFVLEDELLQQSRIENVINELIAQKSLQCKPPKIFGKKRKVWISQKKSGRKTRMRQSCLSRPIQSLCRLPSSTR